MTGPDENDRKPAAGRFADMAEFLAHAHAMEIEAEERYGVLADQMEVHNNQELATIFRTLSDVEGRHADEIKTRAGGPDMKRLAPSDTRWFESEAPETADLADVHYLMTAHHALQIALRAEESAYQFFHAVAEATPNAELRDLAREFAAEERDHISQVEQLMARYPEPREDWADDMDPPVSPE
jgi:rubrerythrin